MNSLALRLEATSPANIWNLFARVLLIATSTLLLMSPLQAQESGVERVALVIGNGAYENVAELKNPPNDSADLAAALTAVGFEVLLHTDQTQGSMLNTLRDFRRRASRAEIALVYFAGHGIEIDRQNYLLPVDAVLETDSDVNFEAVKLETMIFSASGAKQLSMVIVDACRNNPFAASMSRSTASRSIGHGLSSVEPTKNTLVAFAAKEGTTAADGTGRNSPYANALVAALGQPNLEVGLMMRKVREDVLQLTGGLQEPAVYGALPAEQIFLNDTRSLSPVAPEFIVTDRAIEDVPNASAGEIVFWKSISDSFQTSDLQTYLEIYPDGFFAELARARIKQAGGTVPQLRDPPAKVARDNTVSEPDIEDGFTRSEMVELQERLSALGHALGPADGIAGRRTEAAIRDYEKAKKLPVTGQATRAVLSALRDQVTDADLTTWRSKQTARASRKNATPTRTKAVARPKVAAPKPTAAKPKSPSKPAAKQSQFCEANKQCATSQCRIGDSGEFWRKTRGCKFCSVYAQRCN
ncbi:putative caspase-like protein [Litoreibacter meonggei]|uniref:Putative caspase-like protein n=1 Tax=Litoreibacter meonggei TaxID=1049199 RepID=A0A497X1R7_9RHOB|nr:putative caspase-like protein [Litoreibacter meonggei]